jgi:CHAD domain-containing protein
MEILENRFQEQIKIFNKSLRGQAKHLSFEGVHDLRVSTRRLRAWINLLEKSSSSKLPEVSRRALKELGEILGDRRQWDVTLRGARKYHLKEPELLKAQRTAGSELSKLLRSPEIQRLPQELSVFGKSFGVKIVSVQERTLRKIRGDLKKWLRQKHFSKKELHQLRISTKKIRYALESLDLPVEALKGLQDQLGKCHDLMILSEYFDQAKQVKKDEQRERKKAQKQIRPALRSSLDVLESLR